MSMIRVLHVIPAVASRYGGPSTAIWPMIAALRELGGFDVDIATTDADGPGRRLDAVDLPDRGSGVYLFRHEGGETLKYSPALSIWLAAHAGDYDVIQSHSIWNYPAAVACRAARRDRVPYVIRPCGMLSSYTWCRSQWKKRAYWWLRERRNVRGAAGFHATSDDERREILSLGVRVPVEVIPLGVGGDAWKTPVEPNWLREQCPRVGDRPIMLFLSRLHPKKGIADLLLPALARMKNEAFLVIAGGDDEHAAGFARHVEGEVDRLGLGEKVALLGPVSPERRWAALDGAEMFVLPSHSENFGIVVAEAMARGKPVVVTAGVQFAHHVKASKGGAVVRADVGDLAATLDSWMADGAGRACAGELGRAYIQRHLSWRRTADRLGELYRGLALAR
jgi:glycosyltransferase involved in cell wall biosynthesis